MGAPVAWLPRAFDLPPGAWKVLTWGGLRGGISIALALSLPPMPGRETVIAATYAVVIFSILVQALTMGPLVARLGVAEQAHPSGATAGAAADVVK